jgi:hypothetical protein
MDLKQIMIVFALLLGLILIAPVGVVYGQTPILNQKTQPQLNLGQTPTLNKLNLENSQSTQCLDFNYDKICEYIILANGTMIKNPNPVSTAAPASTTGDLDISQVQQPPVKQEPLKATCPESVYKIEGGYCDYVTLENGTRIKNPNNISLVVVEVQKQPQSVQEQQQMTQKILPPGGKCLGFQSSPAYCKNIQMPDGSMILNKHWSLNVFTVDPNVLYANDPYVGSTEPGPSKEDTQTQTQTQTQTVDDTPDTDVGKDRKDDNKAILCNDPSWNGEGTCIDLVFQNVEEMLM